MNLKPGLTSILSSYKISKLLFDNDSYNSSDVLQGSIFDGAGNRLTIAAAAKTDDKTKADSELSSYAVLSAGDYLSVNVDQIGSTVAGSDLTIVLEAVLL